jgi:hypothetical protein
MGIRLFVGKNETHQHETQTNSKQQPVIQRYGFDAIAALHQVKEQKKAAGPQKDIDPPSIEHEEKKEDPNQRKNDPKGM